MIAMRRIIINGIDLGTLKNFRIEGQLYQGVDIGVRMSNPFIGPTVADSINSSPETSFIEIYENDSLILYSDNINRAEASLDEWAGEMCERLFVELNESIKAGPRPTE